MCHSSGCAGFAFQYTFKLLLPIGYRVLMPLLEYFQLISEWNQNFVINYASLGAYSFHLRVMVCQIIICRQNFVRVQFSSQLLAYLQRTQ